MTRMTYFIKSHCYPRSSISLLSGLLFFLSFCLFYLCFFFVVFFSFFSYDSSAGKGGGFQGNRDESSGRRFRLLRKAQRRDDSFIQAVQPNLVTTMTFPTPRNCSSFRIEIMVIPRVSYSRPPLNK